MFSKTNFIVPINTDVVLKIRNITGAIVHILRELTCTLSVTGDSIYIKQSAESSTIVLNFSNGVEARAAHILLREALLQLQINQEASPTPVELNLQRVDITPPSNSTPGIDYKLTIPVVVNSVEMVYVNGILIDENDYTVNIIPPYITWLGTAPYILETDDTVAVLYL